MYNTVTPKRAIICVSRPRNMFFFCQFFAADIHFFVKLKATHLNFDVKLDIFKISKNYIHHRDN
jgi:hypothetical protein